MQITTNWLGSFSRYNIVAQEIDRLLRQKPSKDNLPKSYLDSAKNDLPRMIHELSQVSAISEEALSQVRFDSNEDLILDGYANKDLRGSPIFTVSLGLLLSLDDLFFRLCTNMDFFSTDFNYDMNPSQFGARLWEGTECAWLHEGGMIIPHTRFYDYRQQGRFHNMRAPGDVDMGTFLSGFYHVVPFGDEERIRLAAQMVASGLLWVMLHEEGHYWNGHLDYLSNNKIKEARLNEVSEKKGSDELNTLLKVFEWEADRHATSGIIDVMMRPENAYFPLPRYCSAPYWRLRLLLTSVGAVTLIFEKARQLYGTASSYPTPRTRCIATITNSFNRILKSSSPVLKAYDNNALLSAASGSLYDLMIAESLLPQKEDLVDRGPGFHPSGTPQTYKFIESEQEITDIINVVLLNDLSTCQNPEAIQRKWSSELLHLATMHKTTVYDALTPYRKY